MKFILICLALTLLLAVPLGWWIKKVMMQEVGFVNRSVSWILQKCRIPECEMGWKKYLAAVLALSFLSLLLLFGLCLFNGMNPQTAFSTAASFVTNTNWQSYDPSLALNWQTESAGIAVQNFISAGAGICILFALSRGLVRTRAGRIGNFWKDLAAVLLFVLLPVNLVLSLLLGAGGVPMQMQDHIQSSLIEPAAVDREGNILEDAEIDPSSLQVSVDGKTIPDASIITSQLLPSGLMASQEAIKQSGTNGGGLSLANSASPLENPSLFTDLLENMAILLIPVSLCFSFGFAIGKKKQGYALFAAMAILFALAAVLILWSESRFPSMEGKEVRLGILPSAFWSASTTAASSGSSNMAINSLTSMAQLGCMVLMQVGEVVFGGCGSGLYGMIAFVILTVFIAGLMVGRTPEFLGKKIEPYEMKWTAILCLASPVCILLGSAAGAAFPMQGLDAGAHGFSQILYAWSSMGANNGSAMAGMETGGLLVTLFGGILMLASRFVPIAGALAIAGSLSMKKRTAQSAGTLKTDSPMFVFLLIVIVLLIGALSFFPALALGPAAEFLG